MGNDNTPKQLKIYYQGSGQVINYFSKTQKRDLLQTIFKHLNLLQKLTFNQLERQYIFQNENGEPVVFDPQSFPKILSLFLTFQDIISPKEISDAKWFWDENWNKQNCGYSLTNNNLKVSAIGYPKGSMPILISNKSFKKGVYKWRIQFTQQRTYQAAGITEAKQFKFLSEFGKNFNSCPLFYKTSGGIGAEMNVDIELNMDKRTIKTNGKLIENLPSEVYAAICIKSDSGALLKHI